LATGDVRLLNETEPIRKDYFMLGMLI
jgi:hypothetical protein